MIKNPKVETLTIKRVIKNDHGVFGVMIHNYEPFALTAELPWHDGKRSISSIPAGVYICKRYKSAKYPNTFHVTNVKGRTKILLHKGNVPKKDSKGCILVGEQFEKLSGKQAVVSSKKGFSEFMQRFRGVRAFYLDIVDP